MRRWSNHLRYLRQAQAPKELGYQKSATEGWRRCMSCPSVPQLAESSSVPDLVESSSVPELVEGIEATGAPGLTRPQKGPTLVA
jgi:carbamate kinase